MAQFFAFKDIQRELNWRGTNSSPDLVANLDLTRRGADWTGSGGAQLETMLGTERRVVQVPCLGWWDVANLPPQCLVGTNSV